MFDEIRYAVRSWLASPAFTFVAVVTLALGIGASTAIFSVVNAVLLKPLPFKNSDRLVMLWEQTLRDGELRPTSSQRISCCRNNPINFIAWRDQNQSFEQMAAFMQVLVNLIGDGEPEQVPALVVVNPFFEVLGIQPVLGRTFRPEEDTPGNNNVVIVSHELWQRRWGGNPDVVGRKLTMNNRLVEVVGVMPPEFRFPNTRADLWVPLGMDQETMLRTGRFLSTVARLRADVPLERARADMDRVAAGLRTARPEFNAKWGVEVVSLREQAVGVFRTALWVLFGAVGFLLMTACANVANLMLIRSTRRERDLAVRAALGASRARLARQLLVESLTLSSGAGGFGILAAIWGIRVLVAMLPDGLTIYNVTAIGVDWAVLLFTLVTTISTGILFGVVPALKAGRLNTHDSLKEGARGISGAKSRTRAALVIAEIALSMILLVGAGLLIRSFDRLLRVDPGFRPDNVLTMRVSLGGRSGQQSAAFLEQVLARIRTVPEVTAAGSIHFLPLSGLLSATGFWRDDRPQPRSGEQPSTQTFVITEGYFAAMGIPLLAGRMFDARDRDGAPLVTIVNRDLANRFFSGENPIGKRLHIQWGRPQVTYEIVGVVGSIRHVGMERAPESALFLASLQEPNGAYNLVIRTAGDPLRVAAAVKGEISTVDRSIPVSQIRPMGEYVARSVTQPRFNMVLITTFATLALALAAVGLFGVIAYSVAQRTREIGIRRALGAADGRVVGMVLKQGMALASAGVVLGTGGALLLSRFLETLLFGIEATDAVTFAGVATVLATVALAACYLPARRAARIDPLVALRYE
jgi:putative ABC transport system permease protein